MQKTKGNPLLCFRAGKYFDLTIRGKTSQVRQIGINYFNRKVVPFLFFKVDWPL
jgi:hypothetical protein